MVLLLKALARLNLRGQVWDSGCQKKKKKKSCLPGTDTPATSGLFVSAQLSVELCDQDQGADLTAEQLTKILNIKTCVNSRFTY